MAELKLRHARNPERMTQVELKVTPTPSGWVGEGWFRVEDLTDHVMAPVVNPKKEEVMALMAGQIKAALSRAIIVRIQGFHESCRKLEASNRLFRGIARGRSQLLDNILKEMKREALINKRASWSNLKWNNRVAADLEEWARKP
jgi:hypothetical protein